MYIISLEKIPITIQEQRQAGLSPPKLIYFREFDNAMKRARELMKDKTKIWYRLEVLEVDTFPCDCEDDKELIIGKEQTIKPLW